MRHCFAGWVFCFLSDESKKLCIACSMEWMQGLPECLQKELQPMAEKLCNVRLFAGKRGSADLTDGGKRLDFVPNSAQLTEIAQRLCERMLRISPEKTAQGYIPLRGGHRMGLCGRVTERNGRLELQEVGSVCIRVAHEIKGCGILAADRYLHLPGGMLICGVPGSGKTTLLRDIVRLISDTGVAVGLSDERGEVAACVQGVPQLDVGARTHVLDGCEKSKALRWLLRGMCPSALAMDELYGADDCAAVKEAAACGVPVIATMHAGSVEEIFQRACMRELLEEQVFMHVIIVAEHEIRRMISKEEILCCGR